MFKLNKKKSFSFFVFLIIFLVFLKIDFRYKTDWTCCSDDFDYFSHAESLIIDFDFDYSNQLSGFEGERYLYNDKNAPIGFFGTGLLSSPFLFLGNLLDNLIDSSGKPFNYKILLYSFASLFALFTTYLYLIKSSKLLNVSVNKNLILLFLLGSGLSYYSFERYSMTHTFDALAVTLFIYFLIKFYKYENTNHIYGVFLFALLAFLVRWTNYQIFLIPYIIQKLFYPQSKRRLYKQYMFFPLLGLSNFIFLVHSYLVWGIFTYNPSRIYQGHEFLNNYLFELSNNFIFFLTQNIRFYINSLFSQEFGVFWFSPIIFFGLISTFFFIKKKKFVSLILLILYGFYFTIVNVWEGTGNAYGLRFIYPTIPISIFVYFYYLKNNQINKYLNIYLIYFSIFSLISVLFFETWEGTQLSLDYIVNSYGSLQIYSQPKYLTGLISSFLIVDSYLKIFVTSYLGVILFKLVFLFINPESFISILNNLGLPTNNPDFIKYIDQVLETNFLTLFIIILLIYIIFIIYRSSFRVNPENVN